MIIKQYVTPFIWTKKQKKLLMKVTLMMYLNLPIVIFISNIQKSLGKGSGVIIQS